MAKKIIDIDALEVGMYVAQIAEQRAGTILIKSKGRVTNNTILSELKRKGVTKVLIDLDKSLSEEVETTAPKPVAATPEVPLARELNQAVSIRDKGIKLQEKLYKSIQTGEAFDDAIPKEFAKTLVSSLDRNPDALLLLSRIREKDAYLVEHSFNVAVLTANFCRFLSLPKETIETYTYAALLHDLGKIKIPDEILHKPGRLTNTEMEVMKKHVEFGVDYLEKMGVEADRITVVSEHHERLDGLGYPAQKKAEDISQGGRILAITDMYDALTADRCYKAGMSCQKALKILLNESKTRIDAALLQQFIKCMGIYPMGSLVELSNQKVALVMMQNENAPLKPVVKVFYSTLNNHYLPPKDIDLSKVQNIKVSRAVVASDYRIDVNRFFKESVLD